MNFKKVLIAVDESPFAAHAAETGSELATALGAEVAFVTVVDTSSMHYTGDTGVSEEEWNAMMRSDAKALLQAFAARRPLTPPPFEFVEEGKPAAKIVEAAQQWQADVIVMGSHGRGAVTAVLMGSVAHGVLHHAPCPVMVVRAK